MLCITEICDSFAIVVLGLKLKFIPIKWLAKANRRLYLLRYFYLTGFFFVIESLWISMSTTHYEGVNN
jgi:hypothetical protein